MTYSVVLMAIGAALLYGGAEALVRGSVSLAVRLGLTPLVIGLTVVAFGTSAPELVVSVDAALRDSGAIAVGNVVGSNIGNVALILGLSALITPTFVHTRVVRYEVPLVVLVSIIIAALLLDGNLGRVAGSVLVAGLIAYVVTSIRQSRSERVDLVAGMKEALPTGPKNVWMDAGLVIGGLALLIVGARLMVTGSVDIAERFGISEAVIGLTIVAIGTSLPEMATSVVAAIKGEGDIAVGNIVGSNLFNMLGILGIAALFRPIENAGIGIISLAVMAVLTLALLPLMKSGQRISRLEGGLLLAAYAAYVVYLFP